MENSIQKHFDLRYTPLDNIAYLMGSDICLSLWHSYSQCFIDYQYDIDEIRWDFISE